LQNFPEEGKPLQKANINFMKTIKSFIFFTIIIILFIFISGCQNKTSPNTPPATINPEQTPTTSVEEPGTLVYIKNTEKSNPGTSGIKFSGEVTRVVDGDTIYISTEEGQVKIRLLGIDCPEKNQPYGDKATQFAYDMVMGKTITAIAEEGNVYDRYGRFLGNVLLEDGRNFNEELVRNGLAWHYKQYSNDPVLEELEEKAREEKKGLWAEENPMPPWEWRRMH